MSKGFTDTVMMIRPANFGYNPITAVNNAFQTKPIENTEGISNTALLEFDGLVTLLRSKGIEVVVFEDTEDPLKPDAIFPNNWISFHEDASVVTYPMFARNRQAEYREDIIEKMKSDFGYSEEVQFQHYRDGRIFLEGTGSMVLDRENKLCFACLSPRTDERLLNEFCHLKSYRPLVFDAFDEKGVDIYHTNVMMSIGNGYAIVCLECIDDEDERDELVGQLESVNKEVIEISINQMRAFAGNILHIKSQSGDDMIICSERAYQSLEARQIKTLSKYGEIVRHDISTIETFGGGGIRCMLAEVFRP
jgi:hypothetical protein